MKILLLEPDKILGPTIKEKLQADGHTVVLCRTAQSALDNLDQMMPELIVIELQLGIHNGIEFLYEMRSYPEWQQIPVIIHTLNAHALDEHFTEPLMQLGVEVILYKPATNLKQLSRAVGHFVPV